MRRFVLPIAALAACCSLAWSLEGAAPDEAARQARDARIAKAVLRLEKIDLDQQPQVKQAVLRYLDRIEAIDQQLALIDRCGLTEATPRLLNLVVTKAEQTEGVRAVQLLVRFGQSDALAGLFNDSDQLKAAAAIRTAGQGAGTAFNELFQGYIAEGQRPLGLRAAAVLALGRNGPGTQWLLKLVEDGKLPADLKFAAANVLLGSGNPAVRTAAGKHLQLPASADQKPLPPLSELVKQKGDTNRGRQVYQTVGTCAKCHKVNGEGKDVGPDLSEIGGKLSKEAMYVSILDPSAGISHNFESYIVALVDGTTLTGILVSETAQEVALKTAEAIVHTIPKKNIDEMEKSKISIMPADLQKVLTAQNLIDVVEYLTTLKK